MKLSDAKCRNARAKDRAFKLADGHGLYLLVATNGSRLWRLDYRFDSKRLTLSIGAYPDVSLVNAREARDVARKQLRDGLNPIWTIPAERTKMRREHKIPLPRQALATFRDLHKLTGLESKLCFPGQRASDRPISENTICVALRTIGFSKEEMSAHGFRALASSLLHEKSKFSSETIERALGHQDANAIRRAYARGEHWNERIKLAQWWADYLDRLREQAVASKMG